MPDLHPAPAGDDAGRRDVDARFLLANDRTLLAWVRTALTLMAVGVGLLQFGRVEGRVVPAMGLLLVGAAAAGGGLLRHRSADREMRAGRLPPHGVGPLALATLVCGLGVLLAVLALVGDLEG